MAYFLYHRKPPDEEWEVIGEVPYRTILFCTDKAPMVKKDVRMGSVGITSVDAGKIIRE